MAMMTRYAIQAAVIGLLLMTGCSKKTGAEPPVEPPSPGAAAERPSLTTAECEAKGGRVIGDIGDGAIHRPDYTCEGGQPPLGAIAPGEGEPIAIEGSVCCPPAS